MNTQNNITDEWAELRKATEIWLYFHADMRLYFLELPGQCATLGAHQPVTTPKERNFVQVLLGATEPLIEVQRESLDGEDEKVRVRRTAWGDKVVAARKLALLPEFSEEVYNVLGTCPVPGPPNQRQCGAIFRRDQLELAEALELFGLLQRDHGPDWAVGYILTKRGEELVVDHLTEMRYCPKPVADFWRRGLSREDCVPRYILERQATSRIDDKGEAFHDLYIDGTVTITKADLKTLVRCESGAYVQNQEAAWSLVVKGLIRPLNVSLGPPHIHEFTTTTWGRAAVARAIAQGILPAPTPMLPLWIDSDPPRSQVPLWTQEMRSRLWKISGAFIQTPWKDKDEDGPKGPEDNPNVGTQGANGPNDPAQG